MLELRLYLPLLIENSNLRTHFDQLHRNLKRCPKVSMNNAIRIASREIHEMVRQLVVAFLYTIDNEAQVDPSD